VELGIKGNTLTIRYPGTGIRISLDPGIFFNGYKESCFLCQIFEVQLFHDEMFLLADTISTDPRTGLVVALGLLALGALYLLHDASPLPVVNEKLCSEWRSTNAQKRFLSNARTLIKGGLAQV
jgi:hypothetical protein